MTLKVFYLNIIQNIAEKELSLLEQLELLKKKTRLLQKD